ncbi:MAG: FtsX-like permease family protein [Acidobacteria bacterium]|nr:FtsX-like permease family protein [Acidobacteriota bacterium]
MKSRELRLFRALMWLLPARFRAEYGDEMCRVAGEQWQVVRPISGRLGAFRFWTRQSFALVRAGWDARPGGPAGIQGMATNPLTTFKRKRTPTKRRLDGRDAMDGWLQDIRYSVRSLIKRPGFTVITVATLALGIGASTAIFSAVHAVIFRGLPYGEPDRIVTLFHEDTVTGERGEGFSAGNAFDLGESSQHLTAAAIADPFSLDLQVDGRAESLRTWQVSEGFFRAARVEPLYGRTFTVDEYQTGSEPVVLLGYSSWQNRFGGEANIVGDALLLDGAPRTVVGVLPPEFKLPDEAELWIPRPVQPWDANARAADYMFGVARLAEGSTLAEAQAEAAQIAGGLEEAFPQPMGETTFRLMPLNEYFFGDVQAPLLVLMGAVGFVLLIACANVAGLMLARGSERSREFALRGAIGASAGRLMRQVTVDSLLLATLGCVAGIGLTLIGIRTIRGLAPATLPRIDEIGIDGTVLAFAVAVAGISAVLSGLAPSLRFSKPDLRDSLNEGARGSTGGPGGRTLRGSIVVAEVALAMVLLVGAGLLTRSFNTLMDQNLGFDATNRLALQLFAYGYGQNGGMTRGEFVNQTIDEMEAIPGVRKVALTTSIPGANDEGALAAIDIDLPFAIVNRVPPPAGSEPEANVTLVSDSYLDVLGVELVTGRTFGLADNSDAPPVTLINEAFARRHFPADDPVGEKVVVALGGNAPTEHEIVGVVGDVLPAGHASTPRPEMLFSFRQYGGLGFAGNLTFVVASNIDAAQITNPAKEAVWRINPNQSVWGAATLDSLLGAWLEQRRFNLVLLGSFAVLALFLAGIGIYGLISFSVEQRIGEMGIRRALGGQSGNIVRMVLGEAWLLAAVGVVIGLGGAFALTRFIQGMLFGVEPTDPMTFIGLGGMVLFVAALAAVVPAYRATRVDPIVALRSD